MSAESDRDPDERASQRSAEDAQQGGDTVDLSDLGSTIAGPSPFRVLIPRDDGDVPGDIARNVPSDRAGDPPPRYSIEETVGEGGMGIVLKVHDHSLNRTLAMKMLKPRAASGDSGSIERLRFLDEAKVTARLDHPGIVPVHELGVHVDEAAGGRSDARPYFTMSLVKGRNLGEVFRLAREEIEGWNLSRAVGVIVTVCQAIAYAHTKGIIHRDLKPANVMAGRFGEVYVLDWGLAKVLGKRDRHDLRLRPQTLAPESSSGETPFDHTARITTDSSLVTMDGTVFGTPAYMSPEQAAGDVEEVDGASDIYSLGAMLYELLTGHVPYVPPETRISPQVLLARVLEGPPRPIREFDPRAPDELVAISDKAMARRKADRYRDGLEMAEDLQAYLDGRVVRAYETGPLAEIKKWAFRHRRALQVVSATVVVLVVGLLAVGWYRQVDRAQRLVAAGDRNLKKYEDLKAQLPALKQRWVDAIYSQESWMPVWTRRQEIDANRAFETARRDVGKLHDDAVRDYSNAEKIAPPSSIRGVARRRLEDALYRRYRDALNEDVVAPSPEYYKRRIDSLGLGTYDDEFDKPQRIWLESVPGGAEVYCFQYVTSAEEYRLPRPFDLAIGDVVGEPFLKIEAIRDAKKHQSIFRVGDRLRTVRGALVRRRGDLARQLEGIEVDKEIEVVVERQGSDRTLAWIPYPALLYEAKDDGETAEWPYRPGALVAIDEQLGVTFEGYPLDFHPACRVGETSDEAPLPVDLPRGSYLFVLRRSGYRDTRFPVRVPWGRPRNEVRLLREKDIPPGFLYVPAGPFSYGGDAKAFQSLERGEARLDGFFIGRFEVTVAEYIEFLEEIEGTLDELGRSEPLSAEVRQELEKVGRSRVQLVPWPPRAREGYLTPDADGSWVVGENHRPLLKRSSPVPGVSQFAAREYAHWRTLRDGRWRYRLPTDLEWEKAARGVDRRTFVWGDYLVWSFCWSHRGRPKFRFPAEVGVYPLDESVYGVRDLAGSIEEITASAISWPLMSRRGGNWLSEDRGNFRIANRNGRFSYGRGSDVGFRLAVDLE